VEASQAVALVLGRVDAAQQFEAAVPDARRSAFVFTRKAAAAGDEAHERVVALGDVLGAEPSRSSSGSCLGRLLEACAPSGHRLGSQTFRRVAPLRRLWRVRADRLRLAGPCN